MKLPRRKFLHLTGGAVVLPAVSRLAWAQVYPTRPVRIVVNLAPGGGLDFMSRLIGEYLSRSLGQQIVIENKPGAGGMLGAETVAKSPPDGYTLLATTDVVTSAPHIVNFNVDYVRDLVPVMELTLQPVVLAAHPSLGVNSMAELIRVAKQRPGIGYATSGPVHSSTLSENGSPKPHKSNLITFLTAVPDRRLMILLPAMSCLPHLDLQL